MPTTDTSVLRTKYSVLNKFTDAGLDEVCKVINKSGTWENLADLLDYGYLLKTDLFNNIQNPTKTLLNFALVRYSEFNSYLLILQIFLLIE